MLLIRNKPIRLVLGTLETLNFLSLKLWFKNPARARAFAGRIFRNYMSLVGRDKWVCLSIDDIFPHMTDHRILLEHLPGEGIFNPIDELAYLALIARNLRPRFVFEIGTFRGRTALNFALNSPPDCVVYTLDLAPQDKLKLQNDLYAADAVVAQKSRPGVDYQGKDVATKIQQLYGDSTRFDFSPYYGKIDLVFIDGAHHYQAVYSDTQNALKMLADGGAIVWHDFATYGEYNDVTRAVLDLLAPDEVVQIDNSLLAIYRKPPAHRP